MNHLVPRHVSSLICAYLACAAGGVFGQTPTDAAAPSQPPAIPVVPAEPSDMPPSQALQRTTADALMRLAFFDLRVLKSPTATDYALASMLLGAAAEYAPDDLELAHRQVEAAWGAGDQDQVLAATRRIVRLDPKDTVAQLRLVAARLGAFQTADERMARYDDFLGKKGDALDPAVRSRLALDAALLCRERSDDKGFIERLKQAVRLDPTNKDAALLAYNFYRERINDPTGRLELLSNLLYSDPLDPNLHLMMATELAGQGAFVQARRFHKIGQGILAAAGSPLTPETFLQLLVLDWLNEGPKKPAEVLSKVLEEERTRVARERSQLLAIKSSAAMEKLSSTPKPEDVRLQSTEQESARAAAAWVEGDQTLLANSLNDLGVIMGERIRILETPNSRPEGMSEDQALATAREMRQTHCLWRLLTNYDLAGVQADLEKAISGLSETDPGRCAVEAWVAVRAGDAARAISVCDRVPESGQWLALARAFSLELQGKKQEAERAFFAIGQQSPLTVLGAVAFERAALTHGAKRRPGDEPSPEAANAAAFAAKVPAWIDSMATEPRAFQAVTIDSGGLLIPPMQRSTMTVRLKNTSPIPMAVGSDKAINTRFLFVPKMEIGAIDRSGTSDPEVVDLGRRLRLLPGESFEASVWPEGGLVGWLAQNASAARTRVRWRALQGFETRQNASKVPGVGCLELHTEMQAREPLQESYLPPKDLAERIDRSDDATLPALLVGCRVALTAPTLDASKLGDEDKRIIAGALARRFPAWSPAARVLALASLPPATQIPELKVFDEAVRAEKDKRVLLVAVISRAASVDDPILTAAVESGDEAVVAAAAKQLERLRKGTPVYAKTGVTPLLKEAATPGTAP